MKRVSFETLISSYKNISYKEQYEYIRKLLEAGKIKPVKSQGTNGKTPALYKEYWLIEEKKDYTHLKEELLYEIVPMISTDYYLQHLDIYEKEREEVLLFNHYLKNHREKLSHQVSQNERSFEIWQREKFLTKEQGKKILKHCNIDIKQLNVYKTTEPLSYYSHTRQTPQNLLIIENKDTFYSMRKYLLDRNDTILGVKIGTLIYGAGKGIFRSFEDFDLCVEPYMKVEGNQIYYFGDLDYEGIGIYEGFAKMFQERWQIKPFIEGYEAMLRKVDNVAKLPTTKEQQNKNIEELFFSYFSSETIEKMKQMLESGTYIPQEILNIIDF